MNSRPDLPKLLLDNLLTAVILLDKHLIVRYVNPAAEQLMGVSARRLLDHALEQVVDYISLDLERLRHCLIQGQGFTDNEVTLVVENEPRSVEVSVIAVYDHQEQMALVELRKIDQQKRISQEQQQHSQQLAARDLVRGLAHEIKNPLGGLRGAAQLLEKALPDEQLKEYTGIIIAQADRLRNLVDRLLGPQRPGRHQVHNVHSVLEQVRRLVEMELPPGIKIERDYDPSIPDFEMEQEQLQQAFLNIVRNAVEAMHGHGTIKLKTRTVFQITIHGKRYRLAAEIRIIDDGPGIPENIRDTLFYPMVTGKDGGTGLGLSIAQNLIDQHKGRIECVSWPGHTEFCIYLPLRK
ncbi:signal transduction histidine kinase, nitrogen specific, NtrB [Tolumonas auensis DSM 9187]|uniref:Sensory histidine kinase/phosphatase NtrB n=1 Tax=Tolumonas auensis (strain DSM 9187 / NBRC 110442 / TA 4) TaxID=595494 RepID=C4L9V7_TOLAT|nr:nitrogen regulation protein NR(II) [Tolumonas auensis]ACQ92086.1 signal transduction histidine kinase, nitrogen specific, NtrB [Tolumonas auensis DSM 9187]